MSRYHINNRAMSHCAGKAQKLSPVDQPDRSAISQFNDPDHYDPGLDSDHFDCSAYSLAMEKRQLSYHASLSPNPKTKLLETSIKDTDLDST